MLLHACTTDGMQESEDNSQKTTLRVAYHYYYYYHYIYDFTVMGNSFT